MRPCYGEIIAGRESKKMRGPLKKRIAKTVTTAACRVRRKAFYAAKVKSLVAGLAWPVLAGLKLILCHNSKSH
jgi:hypothetical protein